MAETHKPYKVGNYWTNLIDSPTGEVVTYEETAQWLDGSPMTDAKVDGNIYRKLPADEGSGYVKRVYANFGQLFLEKDTASQVRALTTGEIILLRMGRYRGVKLNGYYQKGDTPAPIDYTLSDTVESDDGGSVFEVGDVKLEHEFVGEVNPKYFGLKAFDKTVDNGAILQKLINYISQGNQLATSNGRSKRITLSEGKYFVTTPIFIDKHAMHITGVGNAVLCATDEFPKNTTDAILSIGQTSDCKNTRVKGITFTIDGGNPYDSYEGKFGNGLDYNYSTSVLGLRIDHTHYYVVSDCTFVGLRLGVWLRGAYAGRLVNCQFQWNNRHLQAIQVTGRNNNWNNLSNCVFGNSVMNGGILLIECVNFSFSFCNIEQAFCTGLITKHCRGVTMENMHFEIHGKGTGSYPSNSFHYSGTPYIFGSITDNMNTNFDGYFIADDASLNSYNLVTSLFALPHENQKGFIHQRNTRVKIKLDGCTLASTSSASEAFLMLTENKGLSRGYHLVNCSIRHPAKLGISPLILVEDTANYSPSDYNRNNVFYVDFENGDDSLDADKVTEETPLKSLTSLTNWIPKNSNQRFTIYIKGISSGRKVINASFSNGGSLTINQTDTSDMNTFCILAGTSGAVNFNNIVGRSITDHIYASAMVIGADRHNGLNITLNNCTLNSSESFGVINLGAHRIGNCRVYIRNSTCNWTGTGYAIPVRNGLELYLENVTSNNYIAITGIGNIYYKNTSPIPFINEVGFGRIVDLSIDIKPMAPQDDITINNLEDITSNDATDLASAISLINELKIKHNLNVALTNSIKSSQNHELTNQRNSGQQET